MSVTKNASDHGAMQSSFDAMFGMPFEEFLRVHWPHEFLVSHGERSRLAGLDALEGDDVFDALIAFNRGVPEAERIPLKIVDVDPAGAKRMRSVPPEVAKREFQTSSGSINVLFNFLHRYVPAAAEYRSFLEERIGLEKNTCTSSSIISRPGLGFHLHYDNQDVINIQLSGRKRWIVDKHPCIKNPLDDHAMGVPLNRDERKYWPRDLPNDANHEPAETHEFVMEPGSICFVPRGHLHRTEALTECRSLVVTYFGTPYIELILEELRQRLMLDPQWRGSPPGGLVGKDHPLRARALEEMASLLPQLTEEARKLTPRSFFPDESRRALETADDFMAALRETFDAPSASSDATIQFDLLDRPENAFYAEIRARELHVATGKASKPDLLFAASTADMLALARDTGEAINLFKLGRLTIEPLDLNLVNQILGSFGVFRT